MINISKHLLEPNNPCTLIIRISSSRASILLIYMKNEGTKLLCSLIISMLLNSTLKSSRSLSFTEKSLIKKEWVSCTISSTLTKSILFSCQQSVMQLLTCQAQTSSFRSLHISVLAVKKPSVWVEFCVPKRSPWRSKLLLTHKSSMPTFIHSFQPTLRRCIMLTSVSNSWWTRASFSK